MCKIHRFYTFSLLVMISTVQPVKTAFCDSRRTFYSPKISAWDYQQFVFFTVLTSSILFIYSVIYSRYLLYEPRSILTVTVYLVSCRVKWVSRSEDTDRAQGLRRTNRPSTIQPCFLSFCFLSFCFRDPFYRHLFLAVLWAAGEPPCLWSVRQFPSQSPAALSITHIIWIGRLDNKDMCAMESPIYQSLPPTLTWHVAKPGHHDENGKHDRVPYLQCLTGMLWPPPKSTVRLVLGAERRGGWR